MVSSEGCGSIPEILPAKKREKEKGEKIWKKEKDLEAILAS